MTALPKLPEPIATIQQAPGHSWFAPKYIRLFGEPVKGDALFTAEQALAIQREAYELGRAAALEGSQDARDAARYRFLREHAMGDAGQQLTAAICTLSCTAEQMDAAIDAAIASAKG